MKKPLGKILISVAILMSLILFSTPIQAGEAPMQMIFGNNQKALIVAIVLEVDKEKNQLTAEVLRVVSGYYIRSQITIANHNKHYDIATNQYVYFQPGDGILVSIGKDKISLSGVERVEYGIYKVSIKEDRKIKFEPCFFGDNALMEWYANTGIKSYNYKYGNDYFSMNDEVIYDVKTDTWYRDSFDSKYIAPDTQVIKAANIVGILFVFLMIVLIIISYKYRKLKKSLKK